MKNMKKTSGLIAFIIVFSMLASFVVMPIGVSANDNNLAPTITAIEHPVITQEGGVKASDATADPEWITTRPDNQNVIGYEMVEEGGEKVVKVTQRQQWAAHLSGVWLTNAALESGKTYKVSVDLRTDAFQVGRSRNAGIRIMDIAGSKATIIGGENILQADDASDSNGHRKAGMIGDSIQLATVGVSENWDWKHIERTFTMGTNESGTGELGANIGFMVGDSGNFNTFLYSFKNFELVEVAPLTATAEAKGTTGATFTFSNILSRDAQASDFEVTPAADLSVSTSGKVVDVTLSGTADGTTYTITAKTDGITDEFDQYLEVPVSATVTTEAAPTDDLVPTITGISNGVVSYTNVVKASDAAQKPAWERKSGNVGASFEDGVVSITARGGWEAQSGLMLKNAALKSGKTYKISVDLRTDAFANGATPSARDGALYIQDIEGSKATIVSGEGIYTGELQGSGARFPGEIGDRVRVATVGVTENWDWVHYERTFTLGTNAEGTDELGVDIGFAMGEYNNSTRFLYSFKNFQIVEVTPLTATAEANGTTGATFTFSNTLSRDAEASDFEVTPAADLSVSTSGKVVDVTLSGTADGTTYTITAKTDGITDEFDQYLAAPVSATVTTEAAPTDDLVPTITGISNGVVSYTNVVKASDAAQSPAWERKTGNVGASFEDGVVSITARGGWEAQSGLMLKNAALKSGKTYKISVDLRTDAFANGATPSARDGALYIQDIEGSKATIVGSEGIYTGELQGSGARFTGEIGDRVRVATVGVTENWDWVHYERTFTLGTNAEGTDELGVDIGFAMGEYNNSTRFLYSFKNFQIVEVTPLTATAEANGTTGAKFTFSNELARDAQASDFAVSPAVDLLVSTTGKVVDVTLSGAAAGTTYTITATATGITDEFGQNLAEAVFATVTTEAAAPPPGGSDEPYVPAENIVPEITAIENNVITQTSATKASDAAGEPAWAKNGGNTTLEYGVEDGDKVISISNRNDHLLGSGLVLRNAALRSGRTYKMSVDFRRDTSYRGSSRARFILMDIAGSKATIVGGTNIRQAEDGITRPGEIPATGNGAVLSTQDQWYTLNQTFTMGVNDEGTAELGVDIGFFVGQFGCFPDFGFSIRNFRIVEVTPFTGTVTADIENGATFQFSNTLAADPRAADFTVTSTAPGAATPAVSVAKDGNKYKVTLSNYTGNTSYTITATTSGITDEFGQNLANPVSVTITTGEADEPAGPTEPTPSVPEGSIAPVVTGVTGNSITSSGGVKASNDAGAPSYATNNATVSYSDGVLSFSRGGESSQGFKVVNLGLKSGHTYKATAYFRRDTDVTSGSLSVRFHLTNPNATENKASVYGGKNISERDDLYTTGELSGAVSLANKGEWYKVEVPFTVGVNATGTKELGLHLGAKVGQNSNSASFGFSMKDLVVVEATPFTGTVAADITDGATFTFSNLLGDVSAANFEVTSDVPGALEPSVAVEKDGNTCKVTLSSFTGFTEYKIKALAGGLTDEYGQTLGQDISVTITTSSPPPASGYVSGTITGVTDGNITATGIKGAPQGAEPAWSKTGTAQFEYEDGVVKVTNRGANNSNAGPVLRNVDLESGKTYRVSVDFRRDTPDVSGALSARIQLGDVEKSTNKATYIGGKNIEQGGTAPGELFDSVGLSDPGEWYNLTSTFTMGINTAGTKEQGATVSFKVGQNSNSEDFDYSFRNFSIVQIPDEPINVMYSTPADNAEDVSINIGRIALNFSVVFAEGFNPAGKIKLYKGDTDVTASLVSNVVADSEAACIEFNVGQLENNTVYRVEAKEIVDYLGRRGSDSITFKTVKTASQTGFVLVDGSGNELNAATASATEVAGAKVGVVNTGSENISNPVFVYTVYNPVTNAMEQIGTTTFEEADYTPGEERTLEKALSGLENKRLGLYVINANDNVTFVGDTFTKDFSGANSDFEAGNIISDKFVYDINTDASEITLAGKADANADVPVILVSAGNGAAPDNNFYTDAKSALAAALSESNLGDVVHFANAKSDENGNWSIVLPVTKDATNDKMYYAITLGGSLVDGCMVSKVFVPSTATEATAELAINSAFGADALVAAIDASDYTLGLNTANDVYATYKNDIAVAIIAMNGGTVYASNNFTNLNDSTSFKSHFNAAFGYYSRQADALKAINEAGIDALKTVLETYSQGENLLGGYGAEKLDFASAYTTYGHFSINRLIVGGNYATMTAFINAFNAAVNTIAGSNGNNPGTPSTPSRPTGPSGGGGGTYVPTTVVTKEEIVDPNALNDLGEAPWAEKSILNLVNLGVINGMGDGTFRPNGNVTREQFVKMLILLFDIELSNNASSFADVDGSAWYAPYVATAYEKGIVNGVSASEFGVGQNISRQDLIVMVYRACVAAGLEITTESPVNFTDESDISGYAQEAVKTLAAAEIINGVSEGVFAPLESTTRAQVAVILDRVYSI